MAIGKRQREILDKNVQLYQRNPGIIRFEVVIGSWRRFTREMGGGSGFPIMIKTYECCAGEPDSLLGSDWISTCTQDYTSIERGQAFARYLVDAGVNRELLRLYKK